MAGSRPGGQVSERSPLSQSLFLTSELATFDEIDRRDVYHRLQAAGPIEPHLGRRLRLPHGGHRRAELMVDPVAALWTWPLVAHLGRSGGTFTDWQGRRTIRSGQAIATNGKILEEVLRLVGG